MLHFIAMACFFGVTPMQIATALMLRPACYLLGVQHSGQHHLQSYSPHNQMSARQWCYNVYKSTLNLALMCSITTLSSGIQH